MEEIPTDEFGRLRYVFRHLDEEQKKILESLKEGAVDAEAVVSSLENIRYRQTELLEAVRNLEVIFFDVKSRSQDPELKAKVETLANEFVELRLAASSLESMISRQDEALGEMRSLHADVRKTLLAKKRSGRKRRDTRLLKKLQEARNKLRAIKKLPEWAFEKRLLAEKAISEIEDEVLEIMVINSLAKSRMGIAKLKSATGAPLEILRAKINSLAARGRIIEKKKGKSVFYSLA